MKLSGRTNLGEKIKIFVVNVDSKWKIVYESTFIHNHTISYSTKQDAVKVGLSLLRFEISERNRLDGEKKTC